MRGSKELVLAALIGLLSGVLIASVVTKCNKDKAIKVESNDWSKVNLVLDILNKKYVDTIDYKAVNEAAVSAALSALDPHSVYLPPQQLKESESELSGNFEGIGIQFNVPNDTAIVLDVIEGGPSSKVGLRKGDRLIMVDSTVIAGVKFPQDSMVRRMKGPSGTKVKVTVKRDRELIPFDITRGKIPLHSVDASFMIDDTTGFIGLSKFAATTYKEVLSASEKLLSQGMKHLIMDLRGNTGGYLSQALQLCNLFLGKGQSIVYVEGLHSAREDFHADGRGLLRDVSLSVLINEASASSSEIFAGAIQDNDRGVIIGRRSFGKGLVQEPVFFSDGSGVRITIARFYTPSGRCIQKPYSDDYQYDIYKRYSDGEMFDKDSIKVDKHEVFYTAGGREVYGGGGIVPDVFVPMDTTRATNFYINCNKKATQMRFATSVFDKYKNELSSINDYKALDGFFRKINVAASFVSFASSKDGIKALPGEWAKSEPYMLPQIKALIARYSGLGEEAFYKLYMEVDEVVKVALSSPSRVELTQSDSSK